MFSLPIRGAAAIAIVLACSTGAYAASAVEKVDIVAEGIDLKPIIVRNNGSYTTYENNAHQFFVRVFAKARGAKVIGEVELSTVATANLKEVTGGHVAFSEKTLKSGWGVYKKSLSPTIKISDSTWVTAPKKLCEDNLAKKVASGMKKDDVLKKEWTLTAKATLGFHVLGMSKDQARKGKFSAKSVDAASWSILYPVNVVCRARP
jgi:opacity protein-like surface antigen